MIYIALILPVLIGFLLIQFIKPNSKHLQLLLSFSGAYLLSVTVLHLLPEVFSKGEKFMGLFILLGIVIQTGLEYLSKGAEHGHVHGNDFESTIPWLLVISLSLHAFLEGMPLGIDENLNLLYAIMIHKLPVAIILAFFLKKSALSGMQVFLVLFLFAVMSPLGSWISNSFPYVHQFADQINAIIIGVFLHISTAILFESSENHKFNLQKFIVILIGFTIAFLGV
ncbi:ZIP family metal transporter [Lutimonas zeaxanthinifaciens]|uniref:ZIP family metal transporter n=1 Tax=Lutimonas zeaxanthinifaciens TaxID=3060215 RepID=UPI00265CE398|nr:ZIP family metal transporter [Lutimonas sp. YSD2104]WKK67445.1 ZIP family metal transporter [Lutimonas sp. YSD2104]